MLTDHQKQMYLAQLRQFQHAIIDDQTVLVEARRKSDGQPVLLACIEREMTVPPMVMGGEPSVAVHTVPVFEFINLGDGTTVMPNPYEPIDPQLVDAAAPTIATGPDVIEQHAALAA